MELQVLAFVDQTNARLESGQNATDVFPFVDTDDEKKIIHLLTAICGKAGFEGGEHLY